MAGMITTTLIRTFKTAEGDPADNDPNTDSLTIASAGVIQTKHKTLGCFFKHSSAATRLTIAPWWYDRVADRWIQVASLSGTIPDKFYEDDTGEGFWFLQLTKTAGGTVDDANPLTVYAGA